MKNHVLLLTLILILTVLNDHTSAYAEKVDPESAETGKSADYIDFDNRELKHFKDFHIDLPATWSLEETENTIDSGRVLTGRMRGKNHTAVITINYRTGTDSKAVQRLLEISRTTASCGQGKNMLLRSDGYEDATHNAKFFYHLCENSSMSGFTVTGVLSSKKYDRLAIAKLTVTFKKGTPVARDATTYLKKSTDIVKSFRIEGL